MKASTSDEIERKFYDTKAKATEEAGPNGRNGLWLERLLNKAIRQIVFVMDKIDKT